MLAPYGTTGMVVLDGVGNDIDKNLFDMEGAAEKISILDGKTAGIYMKCNTIVRRAHFCNGIDFLQ